MSTSWIPEPPKTPAELEEAAVENELSIRLQAVLVVALLALFWLFAGVYDLDDDFARYGRDNDLSGLFDRIEQESVEGAEALQEHPVALTAAATAPTLSGARSGRLGPTRGGISTAAARTGRTLRSFKKSYIYIYIYMCLI